MKRSISLAAALPRNGDKTRHLPLVDRNEDPAGFCHLFGTLVRATRHEFGNHFYSMSWVLKVTYPNEKTELDNLRNAFTRLSTLAKLIDTDSIVPADEIRRIYLPEEWATLGFETDGGRIRAGDLGKVCNAADASLRAFSNGISHLKEVVRDRRLEPELLATIFQALNFGEMIAESIGTLLRGKKQAIVQPLPMQTVVRHMETMADLQRCRLHVTASGPLDGEVLANHSFCKLIARNLIANAVRAMKEAEMEPGMELDVREGRNTLHFHLTDHGCGMPTPVRQRLNRGEQITTKNGSGHGLGFFYCRSLASHMGGELRVEKSEIGKGTTVGWTLRVSN